MNNRAYVHGGACMQVTPPRGHSQGGEGACAYVWDAQAQTRGDLPALGMCIQRMFLSANSRGVGATIAAAAPSSPANDALGGSGAPATSRSCMHATITPTAVRGHSNVDGAAGLQVLLA